MKSFWKSLGAAMLGGAIASVGGVTLGAIVAAPKQAAISAALGAVTALIHLFIPSPAAPK